MVIFLTQIHWTDGRDTWWHEEMRSVSDEYEPEWLDAEDPLFILYTRSVTIRFICLLFHIQSFT